MCIVQLSSFVYLYEGWKLNGQWSKHINIVLGCWSTSLEPLWTLQSTHASAQMYTLSLEWDTNDIAESYMFRYLLFVLYLCIWFWFWFDFWFVLVLVFVFVFLKHSEWVPPVISLLFPQPPLPTTNYWVTPIITIRTSSTATTAHKQVLTDWKYMHPTPRTVSIQVYFNASNIMNSQESYVSQFLSEFFFYFLVKFFGFVCPFYHISISIWSLPSVSQFFEFLGEMFWMSRWFFLFLGEILWISLPVLSHFHLNLIAPRCIWRMVTSPWRHLGNIYW